MENKSQENESMQYRLDNMTILMHQSHNDIAKLTVELFNLKQKLRDYFNKNKETIDI